MITLTAIDPGRYAVEDTRGSRARVQVYRVTTTPTGLNVHAEYRRSRPRLVARWTPEHGLVATGGSDTTAYQLVAGIFAAPATARAHYTRETGRCADCGRPISDEDSLATGLGSKCRKVARSAA